LAAVGALARLGDLAAALENLQQAVRRREPFVVWLISDDRYDPLRDLPAFRALVRELRLGPAGDALDEDEAPSASAGLRVIPG
jgi:hypothetical protein